MGDHLQQGFTKELKGKILPILDSDSGTGSSFLMNPYRNLVVPDIFCVLGRVLDVPAWSSDVPRPPPAPEPSGTQRNPAQLSGTQDGPHSAEWHSQLRATTHVFPEHPA